MKSITSSRGPNTPTSDSLKATLLCCALDATTSFIPEPIKPGSSSRLIVEVESDYTLIPVGRRKACEPDYLAYLRRARPGLDAEALERLAADGPRYRALGNSIATTVLTRIGESIERVEAQKRR
jgi:hypothetical protein